MLHAACGLVLTLIDALLPFWTDELKDCTATPTGAFSSTIGALLVGFFVTTGVASVADGTGLVFPKYHTYANPAAVHKNMTMTAMTIIKRSKRPRWRRLLTREVEPAPFNSFSMPKLLF